MYALHSLQGHASGFHDLMNFLNLLKESLYLILFGTSSQNLVQDILRSVRHNEKFLCFLSQIYYKMILNYTKDFVKFRKNLLLALELFYF